MTDNSSDSYKRQQIRAFFFPISAPPQPNDLYNITCLMLFFGMIGGIIIALVEEDIVLGIALFFGFFAVTGGLFWLDENVFHIGENNEKIAEKKRKRDKLLEEWGLVEEDISNRFSSVSQIDTWLKEDMQRVVNQALNKLGLTRGELVRDPMPIYGPLFWSTDGIPNDEIVSVKVSDGTLRFSCYQFVVVCLSSEGIATYSANFNFLRNDFVYEKIIEFLYRDIVSVSTEEKSTNYDLPNGKTMRRAQVFRVVVPGDNIEVVIGSPEIRDLLGGDPVLSNHEQNIRVIREMLRDKKG